MTGTVKSHPKWNYDQFLCFVLLYASMADMEFSDKERDLICSRVDQKCLDSVREEYEQNKDYECIQIIEKYKEKFFGSAEKKAEVLVHVEELFEIDGSYTQTEHNLFMMLRKIL